MVAAFLIIIILGVALVVGAIRSKGERNDCRLAIAFGVLATLYGILNYSQELTVDAQMDRALFWAARWCSGCAVGIGLSIVLTGAFGRMMRWKKW